jgi:hypothetical protein
MILLSDKNDYRELKKMSYDGRDLSRPWAEQDIDTIGYHYYMPPETAQLGLERLPVAIETSEQARSWSSKDYPYLPDMQVFQS